MGETIRIFVNASPVDVPADIDVRAAVHTVDAALAERLVAGTAFVTDARGIALAPDARLTAGAILRVIARARRADKGDDEVHG
jgi:hypothetical protein